MLKFLRREPGDPAAEAVATFWRRWERLRPAVTDALEDGEVHLVEARLAAAVARMHPRLGWSLSGGRGEPCALVITGEGDVALREITDAWLAAAPTGDGWTYHDAAQAMENPADFTLDVGEHRVALADVRIGALVDGEIVHVAVHHPVMPWLSAGDRDALSFVALDTALGERVVEERIGYVEPVDTEPPGAVDLLGLRAIVTCQEAVPTV
ncbi:MAG TPA: hypothetical protein VGD67_09815 [Pseudonocardiaceae bacterium]